MPPQVAFTNDAMVNTLPLNSLYNVLNAAIALGNERSASAVYGKMPEDEMQSIVRQERRARRRTARSAISRACIVSKRHVRARSRSTSSIILEESLGAQFVGSLGGAGYTPELGQARERWLVAAPRTYATGTRSARGLEAVTTGFLPTPAEAVLKLPRSQRDFFTPRRHCWIRSATTRDSSMAARRISTTCARSSSATASRKSVDRATFETKPGFVGSWGASDEDMFNELHHRLLDDGDKPTLTVAFSVSNHTPWEYPAGRIQPDGDPASNANAVRYADWSIGRFFEQGEAVAVLEPHGVPDRGRPRRARVRRQPGAGAPLPHPRVDPRRGRAGEEG